TGCLVHGPSFPWMSPDGLLNKRSLVWVDRHGETQRLDFPSEAYTELRLSPDGKRLAVDVSRERSTDIWIYDFGRETPTYLTSGGFNSRPVWTPDGERVIFSSSLDGKVSNLYWAPAHQTAKPQRLTSSVHWQYPYSFSPDGSILAFIQSGLSAGFDI